MKKLWKYFYNNLFNRPPPSPKTYKEEREQQKKKDDLQFIHEHEMTWGKEYEG
jgi:hypothetical protein